MIDVWKDGAECVEGVADPYYQRRGWRLKPESKGVTTTDSQLGDVDIASVDQVGHGGGLQVGGLTDPTPPTV